jgi:hypothetical protein
MKCGSSKPFLQYDSGPMDQNRICVFSKQGNMIHLSKANIILTDGTFHSSPSVFQQLYNITGYIKGKHLPLVVTLINDKKMKVIITFVGV